MADFPVFRDGQLLFQSGSLATNCCGTTCTFCSGASPATIDVEVSGVVDGDCNACDPALNDTFVLEDTGACIWRHDADILGTCSVSPGTLLSIQLIVEDDQITLVFFCVGTPNLATFRITGLGSSYDCTANRTLSFVSQSADNCCDFSGATVEINP